MLNEDTKRSIRSDAGKTVWTDRDIYAITWIAQQYAIHLHHLQRLLAELPGHGAKCPDQLSEGAARDVVTRWKKAGWVKTEFLRVHEPFWIWPTRAALHKLGLPYEYKDIAKTRLDDLDHLAAINEIRLEEAGLDPNVQWRSERQLLQGVVHKQGEALLHRPDGEMHLSEGGVIAIEAELSTKKPPELRENLMELIRGDGYLQMREKYSSKEAVTMSQGEHSQYKEIWYFGPKSIRKQVRRARANLLKQGALSEEEADRLFILWYPLTRTPEEEALEKQEDEEGFDLDLGDNSDEEKR